MENINFPSTKELKILLNEKIQKILSFVENFIEVLGLIHLFKKQLKKM